MPGPVRLHGHVEGTGRPLLIVHGLFGSGDNWRTVAKRLATLFEVHVVDLRNHGRSPHCETMSYPQMADDLDLYVRDHNLQDVAVIGHSMGGKVAMASALRDRRTIRRLVIVDIAPRTHPPDHAGIIEALSTLDIHNISDRKVADNALARRIPSLAVRQFLLKNLVRDNKIGFSWRMNLGAIRNAYDMIRGWPENEFSDTVDGRRPSNSLPALFVAGTKSNYILNEDRQQILGYFPNARFASIVSGHWIHAEAPGPFFEIVTEFLEESA